MASSDLPLAQVELLSGIIRVLPPGGVLYKDAPSWTCTVVRVEHGRWEVLGVDKLPTANEMRALRKCLRDNGVKAKYIRVKNGKETVHMRLDE